VTRRMTTRRSRLAVTAKSSDRIVLEALATELLGACIATLKTHGLSAGKLVELAARASAKQTSRKSAFSSVLAEAECLANLLNKWMENPKYRDATGRPAVLSLVRVQAAVSRHLLGSSSQPGRLSMCSHSVPRPA